MQIFLDLWDNPSVRNYLVTLFGSALMYILSLNNDFGGAIRFLRGFFPGKSKNFYIRLDFIIVVISGSIVGTIIFSPSNVVAALSAGLGWVGAVNSIVNRNNQTGEGGRG